MTAEVGATPHRQITAIQPTGRVAGARWHPVRLQGWLAGVCVACRPALRSPARRPRIRRRRLCPSRRVPRGDPRRARPCRESSATTTRPPTPRQPWASLTSAAAARHGHRHAAPLGPRTLGARRPLTSHLAAAHHLALHLPLNGTLPGPELLSPPPGRPTCDRSGYRAERQAPGRVTALPLSRRGIVRSPRTGETERGRSCGGRSPTRSEADDLRSPPRVHRGNQPRRVGRESVDSASGPASLILR